MFSPDDEVDAGKGEMMLDELAVGLAHEHGGDQHIRVPACNRNWMVKVLEL